MKNTFVNALLLVASMSASYAPDSAAGQSLLPAPTAGRVDFARDIQPILVERCHSCHGAEKQKGGLRLDNERDALAGGDSGKAILAGNSAASLLIHNVAGLNLDTPMPPSGERLSTNQIALLRAWIDRGAPWSEDTIANAKSQVTGQQHWAFQAPQRPGRPEVKNPNWVRNPIDAFVLARLEKEKITPSPEADRRTLIRRLSLDLLGLPPKPEQIKAFLEDNRSEAYEERVVHLLGSPHFGELWGRHWLDLARYADSDGYEKDAVRPYAYLYRDWVINAINQDVPFDQFSIEQLAGDLLPDATLEQKTATGFHRQTLTNKEGGVDQEEFRCKATVDRTSTTGTTWLGLTIGCAECHSHKYDPITQREFYQLYAFFNQASEKDLPAPRPDELAKYTRDQKLWSEENDKLKEALQTHLEKDLAAAQAEWEAGSQDSATRWHVLEPQTAEASDGTTLKVETDNSVVASGRSPATETYTVEVDSSLTNLSGFRLEALVDSNSGDGPGRAENGNFVLTEFRVKLVNSRGESKTVALTNARADFAQKGYPVGDSIDGDFKTGWAINPQTRQSHIAVFETIHLLTPDTKLAFSLVQQHGKEHTLGRFRLAATSSAPPFQLDVPPESIAGILRTPRDQRDEKQRAELAKYYREELDPGTLKLKKALAAHARTEPKFPETKAATLVENDPPRKTQIHVRGDFLRKGDEVQPGTLAVLHAFKPLGERPDRLDLAQWLFDPANPLASRVAVNHIWKNLFGRGLVSTVDDFGTRGETPSHPELLDWLATEFQRMGWSRKALIKLIVTSATYRQSSLLRADLMDRDPGNILLARQNRLRLEAENIRDAQLAVSGLLNPAIGGPSVRPPLPADIAAIGYANQIKWKDSDGADRHRRGLYIFFQRTVPYPMLMTFDAPDSNVTCTRRERSNTPLQALTLLNDPVFFECAQALGRRLAADTAMNVQEKIRRGFEVCLSRQPTGEELARLQRYYEDQLRLTQANSQNAARIAGAPEAGTNNVAQTATLVTMARALMNLDEFVTRD